MYNELDSRALGRANCFSQRFMRPGDYRYGVFPGHGQALASEFPFVIHVEGDKKASGKMAQHNVSVLQDGNVLGVENAQLKIAVGDMVVWNGAVAAPYAVIGEADFFNSHRMMNECGFTHAFGKAGDYEWRDAFGSGLGGMIRVRDPDCQKDKAMKKWHAALSEGTLVMITDNKADRKEISIMTGQTVFFAVVKTGGISITDSRLIDQPWHYRHNCEAA